MFLLTIVLLCLGVKGLLEWLPYSNCDSDSDSDEAASCNIPAGTQVWMYTAVAAISTASIPIAFLFRACMYSRTLRVVLDPGFVVAAWSVEPELMEAFARSFNKKHGRCWPCITGTRARILRSAERIPPLVVLSTKGVFITGMPLIDMTIGTWQLNPGGLTHYYHQNYPDCGVLVFVFTQLTHKRSNRVSMRIPLPAEISAHETANIVRDFVYAVQRQVPNPAPPVMRGPRLVSAEPFRDSSVRGWHRLNPFSGCGEKRYA